MYVCTFVTVWENQPVSEKIYYCICTEMVVEHEYASGNKEK